MEEFKLPAKWCTKIDNQEVVDYCNIHGSFPPYKIIKNENMYAHFPSWNDYTTCCEVKPGYIEITKEQFIKYVLNREVMEDKEIIGWKLKEDCEQYKQAALNIVKNSKFYNFAEGYNFSTNSTNEGILKKAGVLELWFEPVFAEEFKVGDWYYDINNEFDGVRNRCLPILEIINNEIWCKDFCGKSQLNSEDFKKYYRKATPKEIKAAQTLQFGGYDVIFEKVTSGVRITCNGETGTFSQIQAIYNFFKGSSASFKFGSQEVKEVKYPSASWKSDFDPEPPTSIKIGCTTGTWKEFVAIYEKAKSML